MMQKKKYEKPAMQVYELKQQSQLLAGSSVSGGSIDRGSNYTPGENPDPFEF